MSRADGVHDFPVLALRCDGDCIDYDGCEEMTFTLDESLIDEDVCLSDRCQVRYIAYISPTGEVSGIARCEFCHRTQSYEIEQN